MNTLFLCFSAGGDRPGGGGAGRDGRTAGRAGEVPFCGPDGRLFLAPHGGPASQPNVGPRLSPRWVHFYTVFNAEVAGEQS